MASKSTAKNTRSCIPKTAKEFRDFIKKATDKQLQKVGFCRWEEQKISSLWLIPGSWYHCIPNGFPLICIDGKKHSFKKGITDNDTRYGLLAFGLKRLNRSKQ